MTSINSLNDFLDAMDNNPAWREAVRARILGEELMQLPPRFDRFEKEFHEFREETRETLTRHSENFARIDTTLARHDKRFTQIDTTLARHDGFFNNLRGVDYEGQASFGAGRRLGRILGTRLWHQIDSRPRGGPSELFRFLNQYPLQDLGEEQNTLDDQAYYDALRVDLVYQFELASGESVLAAGEASVTVQRHDVERARRRAAAIQKMTGTTTLAFVIGAAITPGALEEAESAEETTVRWLQMDEAPESD